MLSLEEVSDLRREVLGLVKQHREQREELERLREVAILHLCKLMPNSIIG